MTASTPSPARQVQSFASQEVCFHIIDIFPNDAITFMHSYSNQFGGNEGKSKESKENKIVLSLDA